ncbi:MAG TPA: nuclease-related domain-containing protein [Thermoanaerobaculia bacterium]
MRFTNWGPQRTVKSILRLARDFRSKGNYGRLRCALLAGITYKGQEFLTAFERTGALLSDGQPPKKFGTFLNDLQKAIAKAREPEWHILEQRLKTYQAYHQLTLSVADDGQTAMRLLKTRPRHIIKQVLALANIAFLRAYFAYHVPDDVATVLDEMGEPEDAAQIASLLVSLANKIKPLDSWDLGRPSIGDLNDQNLITLVRCGRALVARHRIAKEVSLFGYDLQHRMAASGDLYIVTPPSSAFEYGMSLGYIRMRIGTGPSVATDKKRSKLIDLMTAAENIFNSNHERIAEIRGANMESRRIRVTLPISSDLYKVLAEIELYDDALRDDHLAQNFLLPLRTPSGEPVVLTQTMTVEEFLRIWRLMQFLSLMDIAALRHYQKIEPTATRNSVVRVIKADDLIEMIAALDVDPERAREFLCLVAANVNSLGYYDLQYRPFLQIAAVDMPEENFRSPMEFVVVPAVVATANVLRNVQIANKIRLADLPQQFVEVVADLLRQHFTLVTINRRVKTTEGATDIDVVLLHNEDLILFECKHSVFPSDPHEVRDAWEDIEKGIRQLQFAASVLADPNRCRAYLAGWFPNRQRPHPTSVRVVPCAISSHRVFSGIHHNGVAIRDYASLSHLATEGIAFMGPVEEDGSTLLRRFRITEAAGFSAADLLNYLSPESRYFKVFAGFMRPVSRLFRVGSLTIAHETYVWHLCVDEWIKYMEATGFHRLPDVAGTMEVPLSLEQVPGDLKQPKEE